MFLNKNGQLTRYALACGYVEVTHAAGVEVRTQMIHETIFVSSPPGYPRLPYPAAFRTVTQARKAAAKLRCLLRGGKR